MTVLIIQPGPAAGYDTYIDEQNPTTNYKTATSFYIKGTSPNRKQPLIQFDLSLLPIGANISKAEFKVKAVSYSGSILHHCHEITQVWYDDTVTWDTRPIPGLPGVLGVIDGSGYLVFDVLSIVQDWITNPTYNLGFQIVAPLCDNSDMTIISSKNTLYPTQRPSLEITYTGGIEPTGNSSGYINIDVLNYKTKSGTWTLSVYPGYVDCFEYYNGGVNGNYLTFMAYFAKGTYDAQYIAAQATDQGKVTISIDAVDVWTIDCYKSGAAVYNHSYRKFDSDASYISIPNSGLYEIKIRLNGQNAASSGYYTQMTRLSFNQIT